MFEWISNLFAKGVSVNVSLPTGYTNPVVVDQRLTPNFSLYALSKTSILAFQDANRTLTPEQIVKLRLVAELLEMVRYLMGGDNPVNVHSGYRCKKVNDMVGSTDKSQHLLCEAADFDIAGFSLQVVFDKLQAFASLGRLHFGQLIYERANRPYGVSEWLHISLGRPYRLVEKCGQVLTMKTVDGRPAYELVKQIIPKTEVTV